MARAKWDDAAGKTLALLEKLRQYPEAQIRHCLLRYCLDACRVMHLMRGTGIAGSEDHCGRLSGKIREAVDDLVGGGLTDRAWKQAVLPIRLGGFGVCDPVTAWPATRVAAVVDCGKTGREWDSRRRRASASHRIGLPPPHCC